MPASLFQRMKTIKRRGKKKKYKKLKKFKKGVDNIVGGWYYI